jgi:hypothetical protein
MYRLREPMVRVNRQTFLPALLVLALTGACKGGSTSAPSAPSATSVNVAGSWRGTATDSSGPGSVTMQVTQSGSDLSGTVTMSVTTITGRGTLAGTVSGSTVRLTITIPAGGFDAPFASCTATVSGDGQATVTSITATYSGTNSCSGPVTKGELTLSKG